MNLDDPSLLSAFFDDELDPGERLACGGAVDSSPELGALLADFGGIRAAIQALDRPAAPVDLAHALRDRLAALGPVLAEEAGSGFEVIALPDPPTSPRRRRWAGPARVAASFVGVGSVAASLLFATIFLFNALHETTQPDEAPGFDLTAIARSHPSEAGPSPSAKSRVDPASIVVAPAPAAPARSEVDRVGVAAAAPKAQTTAGPGAFGDDRPPTLAAMLGQGRVVRVALGPDAAEGVVARVREIVEQDPDRDAQFGRISLPPGLVVDPARPGAAEVFAVVLRDGDTRELVGRLRDEFRGVSVEVEAASDLVTQLTEIGDAAVLEKTPPAKLGPVPHGLAPLVAAKDARPPDHFPAQGLPALQREADPGRAPAVDKPDDPARARAVADAPTRSATTPGPTTVLIWITRSAPR